MPNNIVRTPEQEKNWLTAKKIAEDAGQKNNYAYIMGVYKKMGGLKKNSAEWDSAAEKLASGYISRLIGTNVGKRGKEVADLTKKLARKKRLMKNWTVKKKGFLGLGKTKSRPKFSPEDIRNATDGLKGQLGSAKEAFRAAQNATYKTRKRTALGLGLTGAGAYTAKKQIDNYNSQNYRTASEDNLDIEKEAAIRQFADSIIGGVKKIKNSKINPGKIKNDLKDAATFKSYRSLRKDFKKLTPDGNPIGTKFSIPEFDTISNSRYNMAVYKERADKADKIIKNLVPSKENISKMDNMTASYDAKVRAIKDNFKKGGGNLKKDRWGNVINPVPENPILSRKWRSAAQNAQNERDFYSNMHDAHKAVHDEAFDEAIRKKDIALSKGLGLYGSIGAAGYGSYKVVKKHKNQNTDK